LLAPLENRSEWNRQKDERSADEVKDDIRTNVAQCDGMSRRFVAHRFAPAIPNITVVLIRDKPVAEPSECEHCKNRDRSSYQQNLATLKFPSEKKRRQHEPRRIESNRFAQVNSEPHQSRANQHEPNLALLHATQMNDQR